MLDEAIKRMRDEKHKLIDANRFYEAVLDDAPTALRHRRRRRQGRAVEQGGAAAADAPPRREGRGLPRIWRRLRQGARGRRGQPAAAGAAAQRGRAADDAGQRRDRPPARRAGPGRRRPTHPGRTERDRDRRAERPHPSAHPRDHELDDPGHLARPQRRRPDARARHLRPAAIGDARAAVETLARRADGVMHFVESYRQISRAPQVRPRPIDVHGWGASSRRCSAPATAPRASTSPCA